MPQRFLKPGYRSSEKIESLTKDARDLYVRLITLVDDFGRYDANPQLLRSEAFPLTENIRTPQVARWLKEIEASLLAVFYHRNGKDYLALTNWSERPRYASRLPEPPVGYGVMLNTALKQGDKASSCQTDNYSCPPVSNSQYPISISQGEGGGAPSLEDVKMEAVKIGMPEPEAEKFFNYYSANGWRVGKNPMRSLPHAVASWKARCAEQRTQTKDENKRNIGIGIDADEQGRKIAAALAARNQGR